MTSTLIPTDELEELVQSGLPTRALERHINRADAEILKLYGAHSGERTLVVRSVRHARRRQRQARLISYSVPYYYAGYTGSSYNDSREQLQVYLPYPYAETIAEVKEYDYDEQLSDAETVAADEYELESGGSTLRRINSYWKVYVQIRYTPIDDSAERVMLLADLVKLSTVYDATKMTAVGPTGTGVSITHLEYEKERKEILHRMMPNRLGSTFA